MNFDEIQSLRDAIKASPESIPLRKLLANALMKNERWEEAEIEIKDTLQMAPNDLQVKVALAQTFYELGKISTGLVLVEELVDLERPPARAYLILAKLLLKTKDAEGAKDAYKKATIIDASLKDTFLESEINMKVQEGVTPEPEKIKPDLVFIVGDRYEVMSAAIAASYMNIPLAHTMGGEVSMMLKH